VGLQKRAQKAGQKDTILTKCFFPYTLDTGFSPKYSLTTHDDTPDLDPEAKGLTPSAMGISLTYTKPRGDHELDISLYIF